MSEAERKTLILLIARHLIERLGVHEVTVLHYHPF